MRSLTVGGLLLLGLLPVIGRFLPAPLAWGFHHTAYLPLWVWAGSILGWALLLVPPAWRRIDQLGYGALARWLFAGPAHRPLLAAAAMTLLFILLRTPVHLLGDGVLIGELAGRGSPFRAHDAMDYLIQVQLLQAIGRIGDSGASFLSYTIASWVAGFLGVLVGLFLLRRSRLSIPGKALTFSLWLLAAPILLYCGYVESYKFLSVAMLGFLWSGAMAQRREVPPWLPGLFYGLAFFFHTTAIFALPALLWLALRPGPTRVSRGRWALQVLLPALAGPMLAVAFHLAAGYNEAWVRREFLESKNQRNVLIALTGPHGLFSLVNLKDLGNWLLLCVPVTGWLIVSRLSSLRRRFREPEIAFLLLQAVSFLIPFLLLDRKLGSARDWDLLAPQIAGLAWLASRLVETKLDRPDGKGFLPPIRIAAPWVAFLLVVPWLLVNASTERSLRRFDEIRTDFPRFPRAYAAEELGKYFRDRGELERSLGYYEECVATFSRNARTRILLGTNYLALDRLDEAREQYDIALEIDPENWLALDSRAKLALRESDFATALTCFRRVAPKRPRDPIIWAGYGLAAFQEKEYEEALKAFLRAARLQGDPRDFYYAGLTAGSLERWDDSIQLLQRALTAGGEKARVHYALAAAYESRFAACLRDGKGAKRDDLEAARKHAARALELAPEDREIEGYLNELEQILAGQAPPANRLR